MICKDLNKKQEPLLWAGIVFAGSFFIDLVTRQILNSGFDIVHSLLIAMILGFTYFIFAVLNNKRIHKAKGKRTPKAKSRRTHKARRKK